MKQAAATLRTMRSGTRLINASPANTTGTLASNMPSVVPSTTQASAWNCAASATVATCVLSPISTRKNATAVATNTP